MVEISEGYRKGSVEVLEVLKIIPKEQLEKVPKKLVELLESIKDTSYQFKIQKFEIGKLSKDARDIIGMIYVKYWITKEERKSLEEKYLENLTINIKKKEEKQQVVKNELPAIIQEEPWYKKIINRIKQFFKK